MIEKYSKCTTEEFKTDISELCEHCPLTDLINDGIKHQIVFQAEERKRLLPKDIFKQYIETELMSASKSMEVARLEEDQNINNKKDPYRRNRIELYIWNKERMKALSTYLADVKTGVRSGSQCFSWKGSQAQLEALWQGLIDDDGYIDPDTKKETFVAIFAGREIDNDLHRVTWIKRTGKSKSIAKNAVTTMFDLLAENGKISDNEIKKKAEFFRKLEACFCDQAGNPLKFEHKNLSYSKDHGNQLRQIITSL